MQKLNDFIQRNFTGPFITDESVNDASILDMDGESVYHLTKSPRLLFDAIAELRASGNDTDNLWLMRSLFVHQRLLENPSHTLHSEIIALSTSVNQLALPLPMQHAFNIEVALIHHYYKRDTLVKPALNLAAETINFQFKLTGALGKRTKHQTFEIVQLVVDATPSSTSSATSDTLPQTLDLNDDTLLETISFTDPRFHKRLNPLDQCILLAHCLNVKNVNPAHGLTIEEMASYVARVLENANSWLVHSMGLLIRTRLEADKTRTVERACLQLQALVDQCALVEPKVEERLDNFFCVLMPPIWELELGERFVSLGLVVSALDIFTRLQLWDDVISCYQMMEKNKEAEAVCLTQLKLNPKSPKFLCLLGDLQNDPSLYEQAWEVSGHRYARAMRSLAARYFKDQNFEKCIECYGKALAINPLFDNSWFVMGCAAMHVENYDVAVMAFIKVVNIDFENGEAWTNLASVFIKQKKKLEAWRALREALKIMYDNQKIWQNFMYCSIDLMEIGETIVAFKRCVELGIARGKDNVQLDIEVLQMICESVVGDLPDCDGCGSSKHRKALSGLFVYLFTIISNSVKLFVTAATFYTAVGEKKNGLEYLKKAWRVVLNQPGMNLDETKFVGCVDVTVKLAEGYLAVAGLSEMNRVGCEEVICTDYLYQAKTCLKTVISRTSDWEEHASYTLLTDAMELVKSLQE